MADQSAPHWRQGIAGSQVFFVLLSPAWLRTPKLREHLAYARELGKPFRVALIDGAEVPEGLFAGVADLQVRVCVTTEDVAAFVQEIT